MSKEFFMLGFDIGGTKLAISLGSSAGRLLGCDRIDNRNTDPNEVLPQLVRISRELVEKNRLKMSDVRAFGISAPAPADIPNGIMTAPTNNPLWRNVPIKRYLSENLGIPGYFENDANCGALAEWFFGAGKGCDDFIYLTMSSGIGAGIIAAGKLVTGTSRYAGEIGHMVIQIDGPLCNCGLKGCYEAYCGGVAIANRMRRELADQPNHPMMAFADGKLENLDMHALERAVRAGDDYALKLWDETSLRNAQAMGMLINTFNPKKLVLGTFAWAIGDLFLDPIRAYLPRFAWKQTISECELIPCALRRDIGAYAGIAAAFNELKDER